MLTVDEKAKILHFLYRCQGYAASSRRIRAVCFPRVRRTYQIWGALQDLVAEGIVNKETFGRAIPAQYTLNARGRDIVEMEQAVNLCNAFAVFNANEVR